MAESLGKLSACSRLNGKLDTFTTNKVCSSSVLSFNQNIEFKYDCIITYSITMSGAQYSGYSLTVNGLVVDSLGFLLEGSSINVNRSYRIHNGDIVKLDLNSVGTTGNGFINFVTQ